MMKDNKLHVAAAPGAGKTVLGLEVIRRLNKRALIFVPTINLRDQWKERFLGLFISADNPELRAYWNENFSTDIKNPGIITCTTYQALYSIYSKEDGGSSSVSQNGSASVSQTGSFSDFDGMIKYYKQLGISTVCLDEAHHLKREWWKALTEFLEQMNSKLIALTATPPMDTSDLEWRRYISLCGEIDLEISIPEMVVKKCLCPHQDFLYLCKPSELEEKKVEQELLRNQASEQEILRNRELYNEIKKLPVLIRPAECRDFILKNP
jgi:superfamily II DNA or RNA helicase